MCPSGHAWSSCDAAAHLLPAPCMGGPESYELCKLCRPFDDDDTAQPAFSDFMVQLKHQEIPGATRQ